MTWIYQISQWICQASEEMWAVGGIRCAPTKLLAQTLSMEAPAGLQVQLCGTDVLLPFQPMAERASHALSA